MEFIIRDEGSEITVDVETWPEARDRARTWLREGDWDTSSGTLWVDAWVIPVVDGKEDRSESEKVTVTINPEPPKCCGGKHNWQSPYEILGGLRENPGVRGNGGGVIIREVCMKCGCEKKTNTWAQRRDTGEQGLTSISYEPRKYAEEVETSATGSY